MIRKTQQRAVIQSIVKVSKRAMTVHEILHEAQKEMEGLGIATVYRTLKALIESGQVKVVEIGGEPLRYESASLSHHHHFKCNGCDKVFDLIGCLPGLSQLLPKGFKMESHEIILYGNCSDCS